MADNSVSVPKIIVTEGKAAGKEFQLNNRVVFEIGRAASSNIEIPDTGVAMNHCRIYKEETTFTLYDLNTTKGTFINGEKITKEVLSDGDTIQIGPVVMIFRSPEAAEAPAAPKAAEDVEPPPWEEAEKEEVQAKEEKETGLIADEPVVAVGFAEEDATTPAGTGAARLTVLEGPIAGTVFDMEDKNEFTIGRASEADIKIMDIKISRHHTKLVREGKRWYAIDRDSRNGTFVNGEQISRYALKDGDHIKVGFSIMQFNLVGAAAAPVEKAPEPTPVPPPEPPPPPPREKKRKRKRKKPAAAKKDVPVPSSEAKTAPHRRRAPEPPPPGETLRCDLCTRELSADDLHSGLAVAHQGKNYCLTCVRKLQNLASGAVQPPTPGSASPPKDSLDDEDIDLLLKEEAPDEEEELFP